MHRWFEAPAGTILFHVTKDPLDPSEFEETVDGDGNVLTRWGRSTVIEVGGVIDLWLSLAGQPVHSLRLPVQALVQAVKDVLTVARCGYRLIVV